MSYTHLIKVRFFVCRLLLKKLKKLERIKYQINNKILLKCKECENDFLSNKSENRKFCSQSCSAKFNNRNKGNIICICLYCKTQIPRKKHKSIKFCSNACQGYYRSYEKYKDYLSNQESYNGYKKTMQWVKKYIISEQEGRCDICKIEQFWNNKPMVFILDHINGDACDNSRNNLRCVCPNCDSQLDTYKAKNIGKSTRKYKPCVL